MHDVGLVKLKTEIIINKTKDRKWSLLTKKVCYEYCL